MEMKKELKGNKFLHLLANLDLYISSFCLIILIAITFLGVIYRYIIGNPFTWLEEVQLACLVWIGFLSSGAAFRVGAHIAIEMVVELFPQKIQNVIAWFVRIVVVVILGYLTVQCITYMKVFIDNGRLSPVLRVPYAFIYSVPAVSCVIMVISYIWYELVEGRKKDLREGKGL